MSYTFTRTGPQIEEIHSTVDGIFGTFANKNLIAKNHNFTNKTPDGSVTPPDSTPRNYAEGSQIFEGVFVRPGGVQGLTYSDGFVNFLSGSGYYFVVPNTDALVYISDLVASVSGKDGNPISGDNSIVSFELSGSEYRVNVGVNSSDVFSVKLEEGLIATKHEIGDQLSSSASQATREILDLSQGQTTVNLNIPVSGQIKVSVSNPGVIDGEEIFDGVGYQLVSSTQIELSDTYPQGTSLIVVSSISDDISQNPNGSSIDFTFSTKSQLEVSSLPVGYSCSVSGLGNAEFVIYPSSYSPLSGDIEISNGNYAKLQLDSTGQLNVLWFEAFNDTSNTTDQSLFFSNAALRSQQEVSSGGRRPPVLVPTGTFRILSDTTTEATWILQSGATITGLGGIAPDFVNDTKRLKGTLVFWDGIAQRDTLYIGDSNRTYQKLINKSYPAQVKGVSTDSSGGVTGITTAAFRDTTDSERIGINAIAVNDNYNVPAGVWAAYFEAYRMPGVEGNSFGLESTTFNLDNTQDPTDTPNLTVVGRHGLSYNLWLTTGSDQAVGQLSYDTTAAIGILGKEGIYNAKYKTGIIFKKESVAGTNPEAIAMPSQYRVAWWDDKGAGDKRRAYIAGSSPSSDGQLSFVVRDDSEDSDKTMIMTPSYFGPSPSTSGINAATSSSRYGTIYLVNSPDVSSDESLKKQRSPLTVDEVKAALQIAQLPRMFQWLSEIEEKKDLTGQTVYLHCSPMAQEVWSAFEDNNLDPMLYGFINDGDDYDARWSIQPQELLWMICAAQQSKINDFESRISALENNNG